MTTTTTDKAPQCRYTLEGPKMGRWVVLWRRRCANRTRHLSGYCHVHRGDR